jgi:hypothetical protein
MNNHITFNDVVAVCQIINLAATRGAFRAEELSEIGAVYDRLAQMAQMAQAATNSHQQEIQDSNPSGE